MRSEVMIVAAEASSSHYALRLIREMKSQHKDLHFFGVGDALMEKEGFERIGKSEEMAVVGATEILNQFWLLKRVFDHLVREVRKRKPRLVIVMDYPEFNLLLCRKIKTTGIPVYYYISPQVWAWRQGRVHTIRKFCKKVFLLFPFEVPFYAEHGVPHEFVGHPLLDEIDDQYFDLDYLKRLRNQRGISDTEIVLGLMPGSRHSELRQLFSTQLEVARRLSLKIPNLKVLIMVAPTFEREELYPYLEDVRFQYVMLKDDPFRMIALADFLIVASGTATLQVGLLEKPMVIMYRMKWLTAVYARLLIKGVKYFGLANLVLGKKVVPECMQEEATVERIESEMSALILNPEKAEAMKQELRKIRSLLGEKGATRRVARSLESEFSKL
jgi:lipid-A-disaccharide synthase